ncbi:hypothetical protein NDU88_003751 [Pleurodeles waltl]|uniref:Uncharacterized protein n=1 Tax=Pleurodeles waltl TaxID=8319 RepID=A0AAV7L4S4_PLEWA|nr:hypothetical protein NDU88_003751 [Pleurodeles waltl]
MSSQLRQPQQSSWLGSARACSNPLQAATPPQAAARISRRSSHSRRYQEHPHRNAPRLKSAAHLPGSLVHHPRWERKRLPAAQTVPHLTTRPRSDEPGKPHQETRRGSSRQHQGSHQAPKEAAALTKRPIRRSARRNVRCRP